MTRRMELGDLPVRRAASLTVRNDGKAGEGRDAHRIPSKQVSAMDSGRGFRAGFQGRFREHFGDIPQPWRSAFKLVPLFTSGTLPATSHEMVSITGRTRSENHGDIFPGTYRKGCSGNVSGTVSPLQKAEKSWSTEVLCVSSRTSWRGYSCQESIHLLTHNPAEFSAIGTN
jgi:hypothetical protein